VLRIEYSDTHIFLSYINIKQTFALRNGVEVVAPRGLGALSSQGRAHRQILKTVKYAQSNPFL
jgi:hypothetical protein